MSDEPKRPGMKEFAIFGEPIIAMTAWMSFLVVATASSIYRVSLNGQVEEMDLSKVENVSDLLPR